MSTPIGNHSNHTPPSPGGSSPLLKALALLSGSVFVADAVQQSGVSDALARVHPDWPRAHTVAFFLVPTGYLLFIMARRLAAQARKSPVAAAAVGMIALAGVFAVGWPAGSPSSPARLTTPAAYYDMEGDASELRTHVTLPPGTRVAGGTRVYKVFRLANIGKVDWIGRWLCRYDVLNTPDNLLSPDCVRIPDTPAGGEVDVGIWIRVANRRGVLSAAWKISDGKGTAWYYRGANPVRVELEVEPRAR